MSSRSTRNKLRWQATKMIECLDKYVQHGHILSTHAGEGSPVINQHIPVLITFALELQKATERFREAL